MDICKKFLCSSLPSFVVLLTLLANCTPLDITAKLLPCQKAFFPAHGDSFVCVCNSTYCDQVASSDVKNLTNVFNTFTSTKTGDRLKKRQHLFSTAANKSDHSITFTIDPSTTFQPIMGFGGAFTDAAAINILSLPAPAQENLLKAYFSTDGIEFIIGRIPMASCDFSTHSYSYDDFANDFALANFSLTSEDTKLKIPIILRAMALSKKPIKLFGSPWSAPGWMKDSKEMKGKGHLIGQAGDKYHKTWAQYFVRFLQEYSKQGIDMWGLTVQNEPNAGYDPWLPTYGWQAMHFTSEMERDFIKMDLGPTLTKAGYSNVKLMIFDDDRWLLPSWVDPILNDKEAEKYVSGIGIHWYQGSDFTVMEKTHTNHPTKFILATEACNGYELFHRAVNLGDWGRGEMYSEDIIEDLNHYVAGWVDWNLALNLQGGPNWVGNYVDSPIIVNASKGVFYKQPMYYHLGHFSKFVENGSVRIDYQTDKSTSLKSFIAKRPDSSFVAVFLNKGESPIDVHIEDPSDPSRGVINAQVPARSIQTYHWIPTTSKMTNSQQESGRIWKKFTMFFQRIKTFFTMCLFG